MEHKIRLENSEIQTLIDVITDHAYEHHNKQIETVDELQQYLSDVKTSFDVSYWN